ncbi:heparinase II/III family protein [Pseudomonas putida]|uniref:Uncharacterized protein n=1 Tax=Pseudomonas putida (strain DOT-T1E) TaxID=1196325 RepID=I7B1F8_PSEPT|nr:heparinase II/III family protein [Pseudomonas putida]AFO48880.1 hypothetical protein T1E_3043 [Pseudomonas putida DOT-T1E]UZM91953.1 heparinase II/III family protein [Pseudomonas putida DOT-T1E]
MMIKEVFANATPEAHRYIKKVIKPDSRADCHKLKKLFDTKVFEAKNFADTNLCIQSFDWQSADQDRNWWWQLQALPFLTWFANSTDLLSAEEQKKYLTLCLDAIKGWSKNAASNNQSPLAWHDHASAYRVRNITNWFLACHSLGWLSNEDPQSTAIGHLITNHLQWLLLDKNYSKHTNHGFDQAMIGLTIGLMFEGEQLQLVRDVNRQRLIDEICFAFTEEGVHKENSPGHQKMMLARLKQLRTLAELGDLEITLISEKYIEKAEAFLRAITLPSGNLPMLGDTQDDDKGLSYEQKEEIDILDYSNSGYLIVRGSVLKKDFHLIFKSSHLSNYHRHDDDLSVHLYYDGKVVLGDGGLGSHNEKDPRRIALRSKAAHNVPHFLGAEPIRDFAKLTNGLPKIQIEGLALIGTTSTYGHSLKRVINLSELNIGKFSVTDIVEDGSTGRLACNIYSTLEFTTNNSTLEALISDNSNVKIKISSSASVELYNTFFSKEFGVYSEVTAFCISTPENLDTHPTQISLEIQLGH